MWWIIVVGCTKPVSTDSSSPTDTTTPEETGTPDTGPTTPIDTAGTGTTGDTATTTIPLDCKGLPTVGPVPYTSVGIATTEDFDFDGTGLLVYAEWGGSVVGYDLTATFSIIAPGLPDARGLQTLESGDFAIALISDAQVIKVDRDTGGAETLFSGLDGPNAMDIGRGDVVYVSETGWGGGEARVRAWDPATDITTPIASGFGYPNGLTLNETHDILYISDSTAGIYRVVLDPKTLEWGDKELIWTTGGSGSFDALEVDACGNLYVLNFYTGELYRMDPVTLDAVLLVDLEDTGAFLWNAMHWGSEIGGWRRDMLYVTDRNRIFEVDVGVSGRSQPIDYFVP